MARPPGKSVPPQDSTDDSAVGAALAGLIGAAAGIGLASAGPAWTRTFGTDSSAAVTFALLAAASAAAGVSFDKLGRESGVAGRALLGRRFVLLGALSALTALAVPAGKLLAWAGAGADSGTLAVGIARAVLGGLWLVPAGWASGSALRWAFHLLPDGPAGARAAAWGTAIGIGAWSLAIAAESAIVAPLRWIGPVAGVLFLLAAGVLRGSRREPAAPAAEQLRLRSAMPWAFATAAVVFGATALRFHFGRRVGPITGDELADLPVADLLFAAGATAGALLGALLGATLLARTRRFAASVVAMLAAAAGLATLALAARWDRLPARFASLVSGDATSDALLQQTLRLLAPHWTPAAILMGAAAAALAGALAAPRDGRRAAIVAATIGAGSGLALGETVARLGVAPAGLDGSLAVIAGILALLAAGASATARLPRGPRAAFVVAALLLALAAWRFAPHADPHALLVEQTMQSSGLPTTIQKHWLVFDEHDDRMSAAVLKRGFAKRLLVNGRFEGSTETASKTQGILAHLPLVLHHAPERVLLVGAGAGFALAAVTAHEVDRIDLFETSRVPVRAAVRFGPVAHAAFSDSRLAIRLGDAEDLLARADPYDVILLEPAGRWTSRSWPTATVEFLSMVRSRLGEGGIACQWIPDSGLTRDGFLALLGTWARAFPHVEAWAGQGGDVIVLGKREAGPHDFERVLEAYRTPRVNAACASAWIGSPETLLSQFLLGDASIRRLTAARPVHTRDGRELTRIEAARRRAEPTVNPVPGLAAIRDDVVAAFTNTPAEGFAPAIALAVQARDLERAGLDQELRGRLDEATETYRQAMAANPQDGAARRSFASLRSRVGIDLANRQSFFAAHRFMRDAIEADTTYAEGFANLGLLLLQGEDYDYAIACTGQAITLAPDDDLFRIQLGRIWKTRGYFDKALPWYEEAMRINPLSVDAAIGYIDAKLAMQGEAADLEYGLEFLEKYKALEPGHERLQEWIEKLKDSLARRATALPPADSAP